MIDFIHEKTWVEMHSENSIFPVVLTVLLMLGTPEIPLDSPRKIPAYATESGQRYSHPFFATRVLKVTTWFGSGFLIMISE